MDLPLQKFVGNRNYKLLTKFTNRIDH